MKNKMILADDFGYGGLNCYGAPDTPTLADVFKNEGYSTAAIGKRHLGYTNEVHNFTGALTPGPADLGFDYHFGIPQNNDDYTGVFIENDHVYGLRSDKTVSYSKSFYGKLYLGLDASQRDNKEVMQKFNFIAKSTVPQLYNLKDDPAEEHNVIESNKDVAKKLKKALLKIREQSSRSVK